MAPFYTWNKELARTGTGGERAFARSGRVWWHRLLFRWTHILFSGGSGSQESACNAGGTGSIPGLGRSPGEGNGNPLQRSCLTHPMDWGAWLGYSPWGCKESDTTERLTLHTHVSSLILHCKCRFRVKWIPKSTWNEEHNTQYKDTDEASRLPYGNLRVSSLLTWMV